MHTSLVARATEAETAAGGSPRPWLSIVLLMGFDLLAFAVGSAAAVLVARWLPGEALQLLLPYAPLFGVLILVFVLLGVYPGAGKSPIDELRQISLAISGLFAAVLASLMVSDHLHAELLVVFVATWAVTCMAVAHLRVLARQLLARRPWWGVPAVVVGSGRTAQLVIERIRSNPNLNLKVVACLDSDPQRIGSIVAGVPVLDAIENAATVKRAFNSSYAILAVPDQAPSATLLHSLVSTFSSVVIVPQTLGLTSVGVSTRDSGDLIGLHVRGHLSQPGNLIAKRVLDLLLLIPLGMLALPLIVLAALAVLVVSPGNPFFSQVREGQHGRPIRIWKLRSMRRNGDWLLAEHLERYPEARTEWETHFKLARDPRVIPVIGALLRRLSLDELPQLVNIARGELSFVGPRPYPYYHLEHFDSEFRRLRATVVPGLTGYWQVTSRSNADLVEQVEQDTFYIKNWSLWFDLYVLVRTPWAVLFGFGAY